MPVPSLFDLTLPALRLAAESDINYSEAADKIANQLKLAPEEAAEMLASGRERKLVNRLKWAKVELSMAGLVESTKPSHFRATDAGRKVLAQNPTKLDHKFFMGIPEYRAYVEKRRERAAATAALAASTGAPSPDAEVESVGITPQETIERAIQHIEDGLIAEIQDRLVQSSPSFFEKVVIQLLMAMGYGGARLDAGKHLGGSGDGGVDGVINQDLLGLDAVYIQS